MTGLETKGKKVIKPFSIVSLILRFSLPLIIFTPHQSVAQTPKIGTYPNTKILCGQFAEITPNAAPINATKVLIILNKGMDGMVVIDKNTGVIHLTNFQRAGNYRLIVKAEDESSKSDTTSFQLTVLKPFCSNGAFNISTLPVGNKPVGIAIGDFNLDGHQDLAIANFSSQDVSICLGKGNGTFQKSKEILIGEYPHAIAIGDFNLDGFPDFVTTNLYSNNISICLGNGIGGFKNASKINVGAQPIFISCVDINSDGISDLLVANYGSHNLSILTGNGKDSFAESKIALDRNPRSLVMGDFNKDGRQDIAVSFYSTTDSLSILYGDNKAAFSKPTRKLLLKGARSSSIATADFDNDGKDDLTAVGRLGPGNIFLKLNTGNGNFSTKTIVVGGSPSEINASDFNGDGYCDLATACQDGIYFDKVTKNGQVDGTHRTIIRFNSSPISMAVGDFNEDNVLDLVTSLSDLDSLGILLGQPNIEVSGNSVLIQNGDMKTSISNHTNFGAHTSKRTFIIKNTGLDNLNLVKVPVEIAGSNFSDFQLVSQPKSLLSPGKSDTFSIEFHPDTGSIKRFALVNITYITCTNETLVYSFPIEAIMPPVLGKYSDTSIFLGQNRMLSADTLPSYLEGASISTSSEFQGIMSVNPKSGTINISNAQPAGKYRIKVNGINTDSTVNSTSFFLTVLNPDCHQGFLPKTSNSSAGNNVSAAIADFNGDMHQDLVIANYDSNKVSILLGNGFGGFASTQFFPSGSQPRSILTGDFNNDGNQDYATANFISHNISVGLGDGTGKFFEVKHYPAGIYPNSLTSADFNRDGHTDLAVANYSTNKVTLCFGNGHGQFIKSKEIPVALGPYSIVAADFNRDSIMDFAIANLDTNSVSVCLGMGNGLFQNSSTFIVGSGPSSIASADLNLDGFQDLVVTNWRSKSISTLPGNGMGGFLPPVNTPLKYAPSALTLVDFNRDGTLDLAATYLVDKRLSLGIGDGQGGFSPITYDSLESTPFHVITGDFNEDERLELVTSSLNEFLINLGGPTLLVKGNGQAIINGDLSPSKLDYSDFDNANIRLFTLENLNADTLKLVNPPVSISGINASDFKVMLQPNTKIPKGFKDTFSVRILTGNSAIKQAIVNLGIEDCPSNQFSFAISAAFNASVTTPLTPIFDFDVNPIPSDGLFEIRMSPAVKGVVHLTVSDIMGRTVLSQDEFIDNLTPFSINMGSASHGTYQIRAEWKDQFYTKRVAIIK